MQPTPLLVGAAATTAARHWHRHPPLRLLLLAVISHSLSLRPSIAHDTTGYARDAAVAEASGVTASPADVRCVTTDAALLPLYQKSLFRDLDAWRLGAPYPMSKFEKLVTNGANHFGGERIVMIKNGHWTYPFHERNDSVYFFPGDPDGPAPNGRGVTSWISYSISVLLQHVCEAVGNRLPGRHLPFRCAEHNGRTQQQQSTDPSVDVPSSGPPGQSPLPIFSHYRL